MTLRAVAEDDAEPQPQLHSRGRIARNFLAIAITSAINLFVGLFISVYVRRTLGPVAIGEVGWNAAALAYFALLANPGSAIIGQRDVAKDPRSTENLASLILTLQGLMCGVSYALVIALAALNLRGSEVSALLIIQGLSMFFIALDVTWVLQAHERMVASSIATLVCNVAQFPLLIAFVHGPGDIYLFAALNLPFAAANLAFKFWYLSRQGLMSTRRLRFRLVGTRRLLRETWPLAASQAALVIYYNCDTIILGFTHGNDVVGQYTSAYKLMLIATVVSGAMCTAYFPALARVQGSPEQAREVSREFVSLMLWLGLPIAALGWATGRHAVELLYGAEFHASGVYFEWLCLNVALIFANLALVTPLTTWGMQRTQFWVSCMGAAINLSFNLVLIPRYGVPAAIATTIITELAIFIALAIVRHRLTLGWVPLGRTLLPPLLSSAAAAAAIVAMPASFERYWMLECVAGAALIAGALWVFEPRIARAGLRFLQRKLAISVRPSGEPRV
ncbi:MAG TPA: flippase [Alphaproteobacteria bacterium]|jgi:O-antigen/teichoic acid export membrane protein|nr:flippase [Alphaproteobacteria bacterium]